MIVEWRREFRLGKRIELVSPTPKERSHGCDSAHFDGQFVVSESGERPHHGGEDPWLDTEVDFGGSVQDELSVELTCQLEYVSEVAGLGTAEQRRKFASR